MIAHTSKGGQLAAGLEVRQQSSGEETTWPDLTKGVALVEIF